MSSSPHDCRPAPAPRARGPHRCRRGIARSARRRCRHRASASAPPHAPTPACDDWRVAAPTPAAISGTPPSHAGPQDRRAAGSRRNFGHRPGCRAVRRNAGSSLLIGMAMALAPQALASLCLAGPVQLLGIDGAGWIRLVGLALFPFAAMVFWISGRAESRAGLVRAVCLMDWSWVLGSALLLILGWSAFTWAGAALVDAMAVAVAAYAVLQAHFLGGVRTRAAAAA